MATKLNSIKIDKIIDLSRKERLDNILGEYTDKISKIQVLRASSDKPRTGNGEPFITLFSKIVIDGEGSKAVNIPLSTLSNAAILKSVTGDVTPDATKEDSYQSYADYLASMTDGENAETEVSVSSLANIKVHMVKPDVQTDKVTVKEVEAGLTENKERAQHRYAMNAFNDYEDLRADAEKLAAKDGEDREWYQLVDRKALHASGLKEGAVPAYKLYISM